MTRFSMQGRVALVTGAAGGLGRAAAEALAEQGAKVILADLDAAASRDAAAAIGAGAEAIGLDVADRPAVRAACDAIAARHGRLDVAIANAGISAGPGFGQGAGYLADVADDQWDRVLSVNLSGVFATIQGAARHMDRGGAIVTIASVAGLKADPLVGHAYAATKAAVVNLTRQGALELAPRGIRLNAIAPGPFLTGIAGGRIRQPDIAARFAATVPLGRIADPDEIKGAILLLSSDAGSFITGATLPVDGGTTAA